ncbi:MAG: hypothetical protein ABIP79_16380, partial [Chitinophagaceae bacterium]
MKKLAFVLIAAVGFMACNSPEKGENGVTYKTPVQYNDYIIGKQTILLERIMKFADAAKIDLDSADKLLDKYSAEAAVMIKDIKGMPAFKKDSTFREAAVNSFTFYKKAFDDYYKQIIRIRKEGAADANDQLNKVLEKLTAEEKRVDYAFRINQQSFA